MNTPRWYAGPGAKPKPVPPVAAPAPVQPIQTLSVSAEPTAAPAAETSNTMASTFKSILSDIGSKLKTFFADAVKVAEIAEPIVDVAFPGFAALYNAGVSEVANVETLSIAAASQSGTGAQKLAAVLGSPAWQAAVTAFEQTAGITLNQAQQTAYLNAIVAALNAIPAATAA